MLFYYQSWMFYNYFIVILYLFLVLTYWHSAQCQLLFSAFLFTSQEINIKWSPNTTQLMEELFWARRKPMGQGSTWGAARGEKHPPGRARRPRRAMWVVPTLGAPWTASLLYKYHNILETLGKSTKYSSSRRIVQNHEIQSRYHHGGVHHFHWCISDDVWVVLCRPSGL